MPELGPYGSVRGARGNSRPYRDSNADRLRLRILTRSGHRLSHARDPSRSNLYAPRATNLPDGPLSAI
jgi:hypothetical protein